MRLVNSGLLLINSGILLSLIFVLFAIKGMGQATDTLPFKVQHMHFIRANFPRYLTGEINMFYERKMRQALSIEGSMAYVFADFYTNNSNISGVNITSARGISVSLGAKMFTRFFYGNQGFYIEPLMYYKYLKRDSLEYDYRSGSARDPSKNFYNVCAECKVKASEVKQVFGPQILFGYEGTSYSAFSFDLYGGLGFRYKIFDIRIHEIADYLIQYTFTFDRYHIRVYKYYPSIHFGFKAGYAF